MPDFWRIRIARHSLYLKEEISTRIMQEGYSKPPIEKSISRKQIVLLKYYLTSMIDITVRISLFLIDIGLISIDNAQRCGYPFMK
jgi:hypothetical protein